MYFNSIGFFEAPMLTKLRQGRPSKESVMMTDEERVRWKIATVRDAISLDWANLASKNLPPEKRKAISQHLEMCTSALRDLVERNRSASQKPKLEHLAILLPHQPG